MGLCEVPKAYNIKVNIPCEKNFDACTQFYICLSCKEYTCACNFIDVLEEQKCHNCISYDSVEEDESLDGEVPFREEEDYNDYMPRAFAWSAGGGLSYVKW